MVKRVLALVSALACSGLLLSYSGSAVGSPDTQVGMWYSTWYAKTLDQTWVTGHGYGSSNQLMGDVNGDGKDDAIVYFASNGSWYTATSSGSNFNSYTQWTSGFGIGSSNQFLADVNGDGKADAVSFDSNGTWNVALSNGNGFNTPSAWVNGFGYGSVKQLMGDVNGDGKDDAVVFNSTGYWYVATSNGSGFNAYTKWTSKLGKNSANQLLGDVNGDGKADAVAFYSTGQWDAAISNGTGFNTTTTWVTGHGQGSTSQMLGEVSGDGKDDAVTYNASSGNWYTALSTGSGFGSYKTQWTSYAANSTKQFLSDSYGLGYDAYNAFFSTGEWQSRCVNFNQYNTWQAWNIKYVPYTLGSYQTYDSGDVNVINEHLAQLAAAKVDFLILDETNGIYADSHYIFNRARAIAQQIRLWNSNPNNRPIKYCIAVGGIQFDRNPATLEYEAGEVYNQFVNTLDGGSNYYTINGKPVLISYSDQILKDAWTNYSGDKSNTGMFSLRWALNPCGAGDYGWQLPSTGSIDDDEVMTVMPGWNCNKGPTPVSRNNGSYYSELCWDKVIAKSPRPQMVVINSFNEFAEETAVQPADTSNVVAPTEKWYNSSGQIDNFMYWNATTEYIRQMKGYTASVNFSSTQGQNQWYYKQWNGSSYTNMTWDTANSRWQGDQPYCLVMNNAQHPDTNDSVRAWVAPSAGTVTVKGKVTVPASGGDGVNVKILLNNNVVWGPFDVNYGSAVNHKFTLNVNQGDTVYFVVNKKSNNSYDTTFWDPSIYY